MTDRDIKPDLLCISVTTVCTTLKGANLLSAFFVGFNRKPWILKHLWNIFTVLQQRKWKQKDSKIAPLTSPAEREREKKRHLCRPIAPGLQHVVWRLSNSNRSTLDYLESFERQPGQLWVCGLTRCMILRLPCVSIKPNVCFLAALSLLRPPFSLSVSFSFFLSCLLPPSSTSEQEVGLYILESNYDESAKRCVFHLSPK